MQKDTFTKMWLVVLVLILISLAIWGIFFIENIDSKISVLGIVAVIVAAFTSVMTVNINNKKTREREFELHILKEKQKVSEHFYNAFFEIFKNIKNNKDGVTKRTLDEMSLFKKGLMNWGSENLINKFINYENNIAENEGNTHVIIREADAVLREIRREFGFRDSKKLSLMSVLLNAEARKELGL